MPKENRISRASLMEELETRLKHSEALKLNKDMRRLSLQSAAYLLGDPAKPPETDLLDREQTETLAGQILRKSDPNFMDWNYGAVGEGETPLHFEGMLWHTLDRLSLPAGIDREAKREGLRARIEKRGPTYGEYLLMNTVRSPGLSEYREKDDPCPAGEVSEKTCKVFTALTHCMCKNAGMPVLRGQDFEREASIYSGMPLCRLALRNRRTAEMLERREFGKVTQALKNTQQSFQFARREDFHAAQKNMKRLVNRMDALEGAGSGSPEWENLKRAARGFTKARFRVNDADAVIGAKLFLAAEDYLRQPKTDPDGPGADLALAALAAGVPDASRNPEVTALVKGLNARRVPENAALLPDNGAPSMAFPARREPKARQNEASLPLPQRNPEPSV